MKKLFAILGIVMVCASMSGCGSAKGLETHTVETCSANGKQTTQYVKNSNGDFVKVDGHIVITK